VTVVSIVNLSCSLVCFASYTWAIVVLFHRPERLPVQMKFSSAAALIFFSAQLFGIVRAKPLEWVAFIGFLFYAVAMSLFWWAVPYARDAALNIAFTPTQPRKLLAEGPYKYVRHPFYSSYCAFWIAGVLASLQPWLLLSVICMGGFYIFAHSCPN
jgi:protein-S-isoprenylcysteine O-methyltransferase Ste14